MNTDVQSNRRLSLTENILHSISYHLSRNIESKGYEYRVNIGPNGIDINFANVLFYRCINGRRTKLRVPVLHHIIYDHFPDLVQYFSMDNDIPFWIRSNSEIFIGLFEYGTYEYRKSISGKCRRWFKV